MAAACLSGTNSIILKCKEHLYVHFKDIAESQNANF